MRHRQIEVYVTGTSVKDVTVTDSRVIIKQGPKPK